MIHTQHKISEQAYSDFFLNQNKSTITALLLPSYIKYAFNLHLICTKKSENCVLNMMLFCCFGAHDALQLRPKQHLQKELFQHICFEYDAKFAPNIIQICPKQHQRRKQAQKSAGTKMHKCLVGILLCMTPRDYCILWGKGEFLDFLYITIFYQIL